jgi:hypothetical protein
MSAKIKKTAKFTESDLAARAVKYLEFLGWTVYKEVSMSGTGGDKRIDILAVKDGIFWGLEVKSSFCFKVICQANNWSKHLHKVSVVVPMFYIQKKDHSDLELAASICKDFLDIGLIEVDLRRNKDWYGVMSEDEFFFGQTIKVRHDPEPKQPRYKLPNVYEEQKESIAGNNKGEFFTVFKGTINRINEFLKDKDEYEFNLMVETVGHHYSNLKAAKTTLVKFMTKKFVPGFELEKRGQKNWMVRIKDLTNHDNKDSLE